MSTLLRITIATALILVTPVATLAQRGAGRVHTMPVSRAVAPRPAPPNAGGFNFNHDINTARPVPVPIPAQPPRHVIEAQPAPPENGVRHTLPVARYAPNYGGGGNPSHGRLHGPVVANPHHWGGAWSWNRGVTWQPAPTYWGGGFWGPFAFAALADAVLFGAINDDQNNVSYPSYQVEADSPGAQLLENYGLTQAPCGPDNLVVIWGPDNGVICAYPNNLVAPGDYELDPTTLTLVSQPQN
jgi:hypothetical protein